MLQRVVTTLVLIVACGSDAHVTTIADDDTRPIEELSDQEIIELCLEVADQLTFNQLCRLSSAALSTDEASCQEREMDCTRMPDAPLGCGPDSFNGCDIEAGAVSRCFETLIENGQGASCAAAADTQVSAFASTDCALFFDRCSVVD